MSDEPCMGVGVIYCTLRVNDHEAISVLIVSPTRRRESVLPGPRRTLPLSLRTCICRSSSAHTWLSSPLLENSGFLPLGDSSCVESVVVGARRFQIGSDAYCFHSDLHAMMPEASSHSSWPVTCSYIISITPALIKETLSTLASAREPEERSRHSQDSQVLYLSMYELCT